MRDTNDPRDGRYPLKNTQPPMPNYNNGPEITNIGNGQKLRQDFGLDRSSYAGSRKSEASTPMVGGNDDLSHSIVGAKAHNESDEKQRRSGSARSSGFGRDSRD